MLEKLEKFQVLLLGLIIAIGGIIATTIITSAMSKDSISVTGSYSQNVVSDNGSFEFEIKANAANKAAAYSIINKQRPIVIKYLKEQGFEAKNIEVKALHGYDVYELTYNGNSTNKVIGFNANQTIFVRSEDVNKIKKVSTDITNLTAHGIDLNVYDPSYFYSKLSDLKVKMLEEATKDAKQRASAMLKATHNRVGKIQSLRMGVFQITPVNSTNVSDMGINDTTTIEKKVTSVANVTFGIK